MGIELYWLFWVCAALANCIKSNTRAYLNKPKESRTFAMLTNSQQERKNSFRHTHRNTYKHTHMKMQMRNAHTHTTEISVFCPSFIFDLQPFFFLLLVVVASLLLLLPASINFFSFDCLHKYYGFSRVIVAAAAVVDHIMLAEAKG